jgi:hypothetical protein
VSQKKILPLEEAITRAPSNLRMGASASFSEEQVFALDEVLTTLLRGGDVRAMRKSKALISIAEKLPTMKATLERQRERRAAKGLR